MTRHVDIKLHYACNNNCIHCVIADQRSRVLDRGDRDFRTTAQVAGELADAKARGFELVTLTGGEPTIRRDLPDIVRAARALGLLVGLQTNGRMLAYPSVRDGLTGQGIRFIIALHGPDAGIHDAVTRSPGSFDQTIAGINALAAAGEKITLKILMSRLNGDRLDDLARTGLAAGAREFNFTFPHGLGNAAREHNLAIPSFPEIMPSLIRAMDLLRDAGAIYLTEAVPLCLLGEHRDHASETLFRASVSSEVRQLDQPARDFSRDRIEGKVHPAQCRGCILTGDCEGIWREYFDFNEDAGLNPVT